MMNKSLRGRDAESSGKRGYGFRGSFLGIQPKPVSFFDAFSSREPVPTSFENAFKAKKEPPENRRLES
ncbi:hypothetical protein ACVWZZ_005469 [Bradyrhizobium sp. LM6.10]